MVASNTEIHSTPDGVGYNVVVSTASPDESQAKLNLDVRYQGETFQPSAFDRIAAAQATAADGLLQLEKGQLLSLKVSSDCAFDNQLGFVRLNCDLLTGLPDYTVGDQRIAIGSVAFRDQIDSLLDPGFSHHQSGKHIEADLMWQVSDSGLYAPVLVTPENEVYTITPSILSQSVSSHLRLLGQNKFGFEDLSKPSDWDWNDCVIEVTDISWVT